MNILKIMMKLGTVMLVYIQEILPFSNKKINPNIINLGNANIDPNLKNLLCQLNNLSKKENIDNENLPTYKYRDKLIFQS